MKLPLRKRSLLWAGFGLGLTCTAGGVLAGDYAAFGLGVAATCYFVIRLYGWQPRTAEPVFGPVAPTGPEPQIDPDNLEQLVEQMLRQSRYALLLRPQISATLHSQQLQEAQRALTRWMALVPQGEIAIGVCGESFGSEGNEDGEPVRAVYLVDPFFLDRYPVTNRQYLDFVRSGAYEQMVLWEPEIWPAVLDFVDQTGHPGPRFWRHGCYPAGLDDHPVVGVCWYEAQAYARWVGKRLPTGPEWEKAGSWPKQLSATKRSQRRYPWGDSMDPRRCNVWGSGPGTTVSVYEFPDGVSVGGVHQLVGNVWEWTADDFEESLLGDPGLSLPAPMKAIRGGAFDTYFESQATCQFVSGEDSLARKRNVGFRCALSLCDVAPEFKGDDQQAEGDQPADELQASEVSA